MSDGTTLRRGLRLPEVLEALGIGRSQFYAGIQAGRFPPPCKLNDSPHSASVWFADEIAEVQARAIARRDAERAPGAAR
jgi:predicted DNA-binding transcriptional regulator AlpA